MDIEFYKLLLIAAVALCSGYTQSVTGFGFGIVAMIFLPSFLFYTEANMISSILGPLTSVVVLLALYRKINWKNLIFPLIGSLFATYLSVVFMKNAKNEILTLLLGIALVVVSIYFFFFSSKIKIRPSWYTGLTAGALSGVMSGLFSIGGPPVVVYYLQSEDDTDSYMATISAFFILSGVISIVTKAAAGFITTIVLLGLIFGIIGMLIGSFFGKRTRDKTNPKVIKKAVYAVMAVSGAINIVTSLASLLK